MTSSERRPGVSPDLGEADVIRSMVDMYLKGLNLFAICRALEERGITAPKGGRRWYPNVVRSILLNPLNAGLIRHDGGLVEGAHYNDRIFDREIFQRIEEEMNKRRRFAPRTLSCATAPLSMVATCDECGDRMAIIHRGGPYRAYRCEGPRRRGTTCNSRPYVRGDILEPRIVKEIEKIAGSPEVVALAEAKATRLLIELPGDTEDEAQRLEVEMTRIRHKREELSRAYAREEVSIEMLQAYDRTADERLVQITTRLSEIESTQANVCSMEVKQTRVLEVLRDFPSLWEGMLPEEKRTVAEMLIENLRIGRVDGRATIRLKLQFLDELVFDLPVHSQWQNARKGIAQPSITNRQLACLALLAEGYSYAQIAAKWRVKVGTVDRHCRQAVAAMDATSLEEAVERARPMFTQWKDILPLDGRHGKPRDDSGLLSPEELQTLKCMAAGKTDPEMAEEFGVPKSTIAGRRARIRIKLAVQSKEAAVAKGLSLGLISPSDPSPAMLLKALQRFTLPEYSDMREERGIGMPTDRQLECLQALVDGLTAEETAKRMGIGVQSVVYLRMRIWRLLGANSLRTALNRVQELGILSEREDEV